MAEVAPVSRSFITSKISRPSAVESLSGTGLVVRGEREAVVLDQIVDRHRRSCARLARAGAGPIEESSSNAHSGFVFFAVMGGG